MNLTDGHPIKTLIWTLFPDKTEQKKTKWTTFLIDQQFQTVDDLKNASDDIWKILQNNIPAHVISVIKNSFKEKSVKSSEQINPQKVTEEPIEKIKEAINKKQEKKEWIYVQTQESLQLRHQNDPNVSVKQRDKIIQFLNMEIPPQKIVTLLDAKFNTPKGEAIFHLAKMLIRPPKPFPEKAKQIIPRKTKDPMLPLFHYHGKEDPLRKYYTFLVVGETGSGKTTLLDAFVNKLSGMEYTDNWRWKLVDESYLNNVSAGKSKTSTINIYYINDCLNQFNVKIIDSPGFGDTSGIKTDQSITQKFQNLFKQIPEIDYILLTIKATETRLRAGSKYIYDKVQDLFGVDAKDRFILMCTFTDGRTPLCLEAIGKDIKYEKYFPFNNSAIYTPSDKGDTVTKFYWKMAMQSIKIFSDFVISKNRLPLSLKLSSEVLQTRKYLIDSIQTSQQYLSRTWRQLDVAKKNYKNYVQNKSKIQQNGSYTQMVSRQIITTQPLNNVYQMCNNCQVTCCQVCVWPANSIQSQCTYFHGGKNCPICPGKCPKKDHVRANYLIVKKIEEKEEVVDFKKRMHDEGLSGAQLYSKLLTQKIISISSLATKVWSLSQEIKKNLEKLQQIALKPKLYTEKQFYQQMIEQQQERKQLGWTDRVKDLKDIINRIDSLNKISTINHIDDLFPEFKELRKNCSQFMSKKVNEAQCAIY